MTWYLIRTKMGSEATAENQLERQQYSTYCPRLFTKRRLFGKRIEVVVPLFPQYLFLNLAIGEQDLAPVKSTKGVLGIVRFGEDYAVVPEAIIEHLKSMEDPTLQVRKGQMHAFIHCSPVKITKGPFYGVRATFLKECGENRVMVLMSLLGHQTTVTLPESIVEACA